MLAALLAVLASSWHPSDADAASQGPVASYSFDAGEGATVEDLSGNEHTVTIEGAEWTARGRYGGAMQFDASEEELLTVPDSSQLDLEEEFTLEAWVRPNSPNSWAPVLAKEIGDGKSPHALSYWLFGGWEESNQPQGGIEYEIGKESGVISPEALPTHVWSHLALTWDGSKLRLYVNGEVVDECTATKPPVTTAGDLDIGGAKEIASYFSGRIDEVRIYDRVLSGSEVQADEATPLETPLAGPVADYSFDEDNEEVAHDDSGNGHDGTIEGATWTARGKFGGALDFVNTPGDVVKVPDSPDLQMSEEFTLEAWVKPTHDWVNGALISKTTETYTSYSLYAAGSPEPAKPLGMTADEPWTGSFVNAPEPLPPNAWSHLALTYDGAKLRLYIDGQLVDTEPAPDPMASEGPLELGGVDVFGDYLDGRLDEVRVYDRALDQDEIANDMHSGVKAPHQGPIAAYSFDEGEGETIHDLTGLGHEGTIEGATWSPRGKYGQALEFDGSNDCVSIPNTEDLQLDEEFSLEAWVRPAAGQTFAPIFFKEIESSSFYSYSLFLGVFETGRLEGFVSKEWPEWAEVESPGPLTPNRWSHIAFTSDGAHLRLYVNGELVDTSNTGDIGESEGPLYLGCWPENNEHYQGKIDEVRVYDRALDSGDVGADLGDPLQTPRSAPVAAYAFDEDEGTVAHDFAGSHDGTIEGANWTTGKFGSALNFDSSEEDVVTIPTSPDLNLEDFTLEAWVKPSDIHQFSPVIAKAGPEGYGYELMAGGDEEWALPEGWITEGESVHRYTYYEHQLHENAWTHIAVASDGDKLRFFVNGQLVETQNGDNIVAGDEAPLQIGGDNSFAPAQWFDGKIDEVRIYDRALDQGEIAVDMRSGIETPQQAPIAAYSFEENEGSTVEDLTGNEHTATIEGATWTSRGKFGSALQFDGTNDCVRVPESADFEFLENEEFTLEAWVRPQGEGIEALVTQEDNGNAEWEEPFSYSMLVGGEEGPKGWLRKGGEEGHEGVQAPDPLPNNTWSHLAVTDDGARLRIYVNGEKVGSVPAIPLTEAEGPLTIGCLTNYGNFFHGRIDEVRIYDRALEEAELREGMQAGFPVAITEPATEIEANSAILNGTATTKGGDTEYFFEYGPTEAYGNIVVGEELGSDHQKLNLREAAIDLAPESVHHYRVVVESPAGVAHGKDQTFVTAARTMSEGEEKELKEADERSELIAKESAAGPGNFYGMMWTGNIGTMLENHPGTAENAFDAVKHSGAKMLRLEVSPDNEAAVENAFNAAAARNITILPEFGGGAFPKEGPGRKRWITYAKKLVNKYGPDGMFKPPALHWEIWNEPNMPFPSTATAEGKPNPKAFAKFFGEMSAALDEASTQPIQILTPGLYGYRSPGCHPACHILPSVFLEEMDKELTELKYKNAYDAISIHPYVFRVGKPKHQHRPESKPDVDLVTHAIRRIVQGVRNLKLSKGKSIWVTELGFPVANPGNKGKVPPVSKSMQNMLLQQSLSVLQNHRESMGIAHTFYYNIQDDDARPGWEYRSGLLEGNGTPRPAWTAFKNHAGGEKCPFSTPC